jgi:hypothetical protein
MIFITVGIIAVLPNIIVVILLWGDSSAVNNILFVEVPLIVGFIGILMPITQAFCELPFLFWILLRKMNGKSKILFISIFLTVQHIFLPFMFDWKYILWRVVSFVFISIIYEYFMSKDRS